MNIYPPPINALATALIKVAVILVLFFSLVKFIRMFDHLFDVFNSRNPLGKYYKSPLRESNQEAWQPFLQRAMQYVKGLTDPSGTPMHRTKRKTGFLGFLCAIKSVECLFHVLVSNLSTSMKYLLTYKLSQDHLELFFCIDTIIWWMQQ